MRRWNGWGDDAIHSTVPAGAAAFLTELVGPAAPPQDAAAVEVLAQVPASRLPAHSLVEAGAGERLRHARGQSFPDWLALRSGRIGAFPDGVAFPAGENDVAELLRWATRHAVQLIPYGGGTSVAGHINPRAGDAPVLTVDMSRMSRLLRLDETSQLAAFGAGVAGPDLEAQLRARGYTLGHFPQSFEYSTLGGWIATRSSGQESLGYGRIEQLWAGGRLLAPAGALDLLPHPASAAGPDLRQLVLGSEGRMGIITEAAVRITPLAGRERAAVQALFLPDWAAARTAARQIAQAGLPLTMMRLSTPTETETTLTLAGHERLIGALERLVALRGVRDGKCMLLLGFNGNDVLLKATRNQALEIAGQHGAVNVGRTFGNQWYKNRFHTPYLRNTLWEMGYAVDTLETAATWSTMPALVESLEMAIRRALEPFGERVHVFTHLSHFYPSGCSIYTTYLFRLAGDPAETLARWQAMKAAAGETIVALRATISHQHGVGEDHIPWLPAEKGELGMTVLGDVLRRFDPAGIMNPGKLIG